MEPLELKNKKDAIELYLIQRLKNNESGVDLYEQGWRPSFNGRLSKTIGRCDYANKLIEIGKAYIETLTEEEYKNVINHEIAHALTPKCGHDINWKRMAIKLGANPSPFAVLDTPPKLRFSIIFKNKAGFYEFVSYRGRRTGLFGRFITNRREETLNKLFFVETKDLAKYGLSEFA